MATSTTRNTRAAPDPGEFRSRRSEKSVCWTGCMQTEMMRQISKTAVRRDPLVLRTSSFTKQKR
jgi:hypothetical protein